MSKQLQDKSVKPGDDVNSAAASSQVSNSFTFFDKSFCTLEKFGLGLSVAFLAFVTYKCKCELCFG